MALTKDQIAKLYIAMFDRAPDGDGLDYWTQQATDNNWDATTLANSMVAAAAQYSDVYPAYGDLTNEDNVKSIVTEMYKTLLNKEDDTDGINYWVNEVMNGKSLGEVANAIIYVADQVAAGNFEGDLAAYADDADAQAAAKAFENKVQAAVDTADSIKTYDINGDGKFDAADKDAFNSIISVVTDDPASIDNAKAKIQDYTPVNVTLSADTTEYTGSDAADTFNGVVSSLSSEATLVSGDKIDGKDGIDTLNVTLKGTFSGVGTDGYIKNVENINLTNASEIDRSFDATNVTGAEKYTLTGSDNGNKIDLTNLAAAGIEI
ncbi:MAG: DUF4214 domain-containing protein, partial [Epsilonproteobacteria bacterium]|nr:DUF4214 domain-containing protein [Campylobacterota bacterium]